MMADDDLLHNLMAGVQAWVDGRYWWPLRAPTITRRKRRI